MDKITAGSGDTKDMLELLKTFFNSVFVAVQGIGVKIETLTERINEILPKVENNRQKLEELSKIKPIIETNHVAVIDTVKKSENLEHKIGNILDHVTANYLKVEEILKSITPFHASVENRQEKFEEYAKEILDETLDIKNKLTSNPCLLKDKEIFISGIICDKVDKCKSCSSTKLEEAYNKTLTKLEENHKAEIDIKNKIIWSLLGVVSSIAMLVSGTTIYLVNKYVVFGGK